MRCTNTPLKRDFSTSSGEKRWVNIVLGVSLESKSDDGGLLKTTNVKTEISVAKGGKNGLIFSPKIVRFQGDLGNFDSEFKKWSQNR